ncbi:transcription-repair coupling factor [Corynebacterium choanae]|uniref:Transcription-repair-coupling factor n=1 Tax=Corynebacterium choanae TaxID=1862358 RepID=A0A3G6J5V2_9CORY|nr:transcription-repair coupling factor [Corynebacterium choanae]AZA13143.1 Transcription-repair-coupling factor [Corynebacterium choanae]
MAQQVQQPGSATAVKGPLAGVASMLARTPAMTAVLSQVAAGDAHVACVESARPWLVAGLATAGPVLAVVPTGRQAEDFCAELQAIIGDSVAVFPAWETLPHERMSPSKEIVAQRAKVLHHLADLSVVVAPARAFCQPLLATVEGREPVTITVGEEPGLEPLVAALVLRGYRRADQVTERGDVAVRGGLVDVWSPVDESPVRVELFGDEIESITPFSPADQRTFTDGEAITTVECYPCRELPVTESVQQAAAALQETFTGNPALLELTSKLAAGQPADGMEALLPVLTDAPLVTLPALLPEGSIIATIDPARIVTRVNDLAATDEEFLAAGWEAAAMGATGPLAADGLDVAASSYVSAAALVAAAKQHQCRLVAVNPVGMSAQAFVSGVDQLTLPAVAAPTRQQPTDIGNAALQAVSKQLAGGGMAALITPNRAVANRLRSHLLDHGVAAKRVSNRAAPKPGEVAIYTALTHHGLVWPLSATATVTSLEAADTEHLVTGLQPTHTPQATADPDLFEAEAPQPGDQPRQQPAATTADSAADTAAQPGSATANSVLLLTETDLTGNRVGDIAGRRRRRAKKRNKVDPLALQPGDYVVHDAHGIGRFIELTERTITTGEQTSRREYVVLEYASSRRGAPPDKLFVPMDQLDMLSRYVGGETPHLSKMGGADWKNTKKKARAAVREIAHELIELYAKRQAAPGHAFAPDSPWQRELEDNFPYLETEDQLTAIEDVKHDMEQPTPMDRVIVGDVGYGKTEVAVRAAFKCVQDGRQVAVLVPTTLLAQQHGATFTSRMAGFPVNIAVLSRFTSTAEAKRIKQGLHDGSIDIVVGTHRLLQTGISWKNLGLVIVDEEQRFGVEHKEHIKALRSHVDVLTMSATPIPRTLEMSMAGIREMSTILTPPQDRYPVLTYVGAQEDKHVAAAIRRELLRDGQVFYIHNKVKSIDAQAAKLRQLVPEARIVVAHGQMGEDVLENTVQGFFDREYDVLVCTTIVETGLDIANANTLIVENAHHMGLSQLHQLRGRVGRGRERAYAYFLYPKGQVLSEASYDRLATIAQHSDLGAGMAVAMKDLEMRGAGNVLGAEQSGHIAGVGFDLYIRLVGEAVEALKAVVAGKPVDATVQGPKEIRVDLPVDAHIPESYIGAERLRLEIYRALAESHDDTAITAVIEEMVDRFGAYPDEVDRMLALARLRNHVRRAGVADVLVQGSRVKMHPVQLADSKQVRLARLYPGATYRAAAQAINIPLPKTGRNVLDPMMRDVALVQWVADVVSQLFDLPAINVSGGATPPPAPPAGKSREISVG